MWNINYNSRNNTFHWKGPEETELNEASQVQTLPPPLPPLAEPNLPEWNLYFSGVQNEYGKIHHTFPDSDTPF